MPRIRAETYDDKKILILDAAASLFAKQGYSGSKMQDIAVICNVSKSMLYHYFTKKEDVLYEILYQHLDRIISALDDSFDKFQGEDMEAFFKEFIETYLERSQISRARHVVALHDRLYLTRVQHDQIVDLERRIVLAVEKVLRRVNPNRAESDYRPSALLLLGMINWIELWYRRSGRVSPPIFYNMISDLYLHGFLPEHS